MRSLLLALALGLVPAAPEVVATKVVALDPGHGGRRPGTKTGSGVSEASITLQIARFARDVLEKNGVRVIMTRSDDAELALDARIAMANDAGCAAFVSVHSNSAPVAERRGVETYILAASASEDTTEALLEAENEGAEGEGGQGASKDLSHAEAGDGVLTLILDDLTRSAAHQDSARLAGAVQESLGHLRGVGPSRGLRQAPFRVLRGAKMPAILVEIGYLSNPDQGSFLASERGQRSSGEALARGILRFLEHDRL